LAALEMVASKAKETGTFNQHVSLACHYFRFLSFLLPSNSFLKCVQQIRAEASGCSSSSSSLFVVVKVIVVTYFDVRWDGRNEK
jgi:hypothetical protein